MHKTVTLVGWYDILAKGNLGAERVSLAYSPRLHYIILGHLRWELQQLSYIRSTVKSREKQMYHAAYLQVCISSASFLYLQSPGLPAQGMVPPTVDLVFLHEATMKTIPHRNKYCKPSRSRQFLN